MEQVSLSQYKIFYTVGKYLNISKAAKVLYISQPAISKSLKQLEDTLCVKLFIRNSRGVILTEEGKVLFNHISSAFEEISKGEDYLHQVNDIGLGTVRISVSSTLCKYILLPYLKDFIKKNPHIKINIECRSTTYSLDLLNSNRTDIGLIGKTDNSNNLEFLSIGNVNYIFVTTSNYISNLKARGFLTTEDIFSNANIMLLDKDNVSRHHIDKYLDSNKIYPNNILEVNNMDLLIDFAKIDLGIACVISNFIEKDLKNGTLIELKLPTPIPSREIGFAYNKNHIVSSAVQKFINFISTFN